VRDLLPVRVVLDRRGSRSGRRGVNRNSHGVTRFEGDAREVDPSRGEPLVPSWRTNSVHTSQVEGGPLPLTTVGDLPVLDGPVNTTLENSLLAGIAVNADPGSAGVRRAGVAAGRHGRVWHGKGSSHTRDRSLC
jgi:hypothetical protein